MTMLLIALSLAAGAQGRAEPAPRLVRLEVAVLKGDPLGSRADGTVKHLAEPVLVTQSGRAATFISGGQVAVPRPGGRVGFEPIGVQFKCLPTVQPDGTIWVELEGTTSWCAATDPQAGSNLASKSIRISRAVKPGERVRVRLAADSPTDQTWAEVVARPHE